MKTSNVLEVSRLVKSFPGVLAVDHCSFGIQEGTITGIIGPNGSGKTTILNLVTAVFKADEGEIYLKANGRKESLNNLAPHQIIRKGIGRTFQTLQVFHDMSVIDNMLVAKFDRQRALRLLDFVGLSLLKNEYAGNLSIGQQRLLEFARVLMRSPRVILLDEPTSGVHPNMQARMTTLIRELKYQGTTIVIVEHNMPFLFSIAEKIIALDFGTKIAEGTPEEIRTNKDVIRAYLGG